MPPSKFDSQPFIPQRILGQLDSYGRYTCAEAYCTTWLWLVIKTVNILLIIEPSCPIKLKHLFQSSMMVKRLRSEELISRFLYISNNCLIALLKWLKVKSWPENPRWIWWVVLKDFWPDCISTYQYSIRSLTSHLKLCNFFVQNIDLLFCSILMTSYDCFE